MASPPPKIQQVQDQQIADLAKFLKGKVKVVPTAPTAPASVQGAFRYYTQAVGRYLPVQLTHAKAATKQLLRTVR